VTALQTAKGIDRVDIEEAGPGDIVSVAGLPDVTIGDTITDPADPRPLERLDVDAPTLRMTFGVNTSPLSGRDGKYVTSRQIKARLDREILGNVSIEVYPTSTGDTFEVRGRGELQLAVLIEQMRREGFELTASRPEVILHDTPSGVQEPYERITVDIPPEFIGSVQQALAGRKGRLEQMTTDADGRVRLEYVLPVRGLIGYRGQLLTETRGTALLHQIGEGYGPWAGEVTHRTSGVLVSDRAGTSNAYGLFNLQERAELFIGSGVDVYEGMIVGENSRSGDMDVNPTKEKKLTNIRTHSHDERPEGRARRERERRAHQEHEHGRRRRAAEEADGLAHGRRPRVGRTPMPQDVDADHEDDREAPREVERSDPLDLREAGDGVWGGRHDAGALHGRRLYGPGSPRTPATAEAQPAAASARSRS
jgi:GTP-binding protein